MLTLISYDFKRPDRAQIEQFIIKGRNYTYVTATKALAAERERNGLIGEAQRFTNDKGETKKMALFADLIRAWTKQTYNLSSRGEEKTMLFRAMDAVSRNDVILRDLLRHDYSSWIRVLYDLAAEGINLQQHPLPQSKRDQLVNPVLEKHLKNIQSSFYDQLRGVKKRLFEDAAREYLAIHAAPTELIIMEGFTYLTELQKWFIQQCDKQNKEVIFLVPYRNEQQAFQIMDKTYGFVSKKLRYSMTTVPLSEHEDLAHIQTNFLKSGKPVPFSGAISNVFMRQYPNRDRELQGCISQLKQWFENGEYEPKDVVIVMRRSKEFIDRLRDYIAMNPIVYKDPATGQQREVEVPTNPRLLLLTPVGRFILNLYQIWQDGGLFLEVDSLESILSSGWLGAVIQDTTPTFRAVKYQYFTSCRTKNDWLRVLNQMQEHCGQESMFRLPVNLLDAETISSWINVVLLLDTVCTRLFQQGESSVAKHIQILQEELNKMLPKHIRKAEKRVLEEIQSVFDDLSNYFSIPLTTNEFGDAIHALTTGQNENDEDDEGEPKPNHLRIVTPETIDGMLYKVVIYVGCDNVHVPVLYPEPWPFYVDGRDDHLSKERYMFLSVVRAASQKVVLSFALKDGDRSFQPSTYLQEIHYLLGERWSEQGILDTLDLSKAHDGVRTVKVRAARRNTYSLSELAHYGLCPLRYRLELLHPEARMYRMEWQIEIYAQGIWLNRIFGALEQSSARLPQLNEGDFYQHLLSFMSSMKPEMEALFPAFPSITWHAIEHRVKEQLGHFSKERYRFYRGVEKGGSDSFRIMVEVGEEEKTVKINVDVPFIVQTARFNAAYLSDVQTTEWLLPGKAEEGDPVEVLEIEGVQLFPTQYQAVTWWRDSINAYFTVEKKQKVTENAYTQKLDRHYDQLPERIGHFINSIEKNKFPKHPGEHCMSCPVRPECLGIAERTEGASA
ncbi:hypothetical protein [Gorillibacterium sp. sgz5001074]|uniref:hypothetical protein n=1 Tax=Gorillibacterium sp. sgz5001074 TaxID=3446695 RepID=UPI003F66C8BB